MASRPLNATGVDFSNDTQAMDFLMSMLKDTEFQIVGNTHARYFWYGVIVIITLVALHNIIWETGLFIRYVCGFLGSLTAYANTQ